MIEEVLKGGEKKNFPEESRRTFTKFVMIIITALSLEGLVLTIEIANSEGSISEIIYPIFPLVFLTFFSLAHYNRVFSREHKNNNIKSEWFRLYKGDLPDSAIMVREHYKNIFELPIFFFLLCTILFLLDRVESIDVILAWIFVFFKIYQLTIYACDVKIIKNFLIITFN